MRDRPTRRLGDRVLRVSRGRPWRIILPLAPQPKVGRLSARVLVYGFLALIGLGTLLLLLPVSSRLGQFISPVDALFTATSAVCVTGLVVRDTGTYWSGFGQGVILLLIQLGGFGFMASATLFLLVLGRRIGIRERLLIGESMGLRRLGGLVKLVKRMALFTVAAESLGAAVFYLRFSAEGPPGTAAWKSVFQAVSAFNNAGFDIFRDFRSLADFQSDPLVLLLTAALIVIGGISFIVVADVVRSRRFSALTLDSKLVLSTSISLWGLGMLVVFLTEFDDPGTLGALSLPDRLLGAFFQSVTARTAGFSTLAMGNLADYSLFFIMLLMFIGGASSSTAGGIKVNTFGMLVGTMWSSVRGKEHAGAFVREFTEQQIHRALVVIMLSLGLVATVVFALTMTERFGFLNLLFETVSAFGTVGLSTGITPHLSVAGRLILTATMFVGRLGPLALALSIVQRQQPSRYRYPREAVRIA